MEKILHCLEEIKKIKSATRGIVADEQIKTMADQFELSDKEKTEVIAQLESDGIEHAPRAQHYCKVHDVCLREMRDNPHLAEQYTHETAILTQSISTQSATGMAALVRAVMSVSSHRANASKKDGWSCGTHIPQQRARFALWLQAIMSEDKLDTLVTCLKAGQELTSAQSDMLRILLHNAPVIIVHPLVSRFIIKDT